LEEQTRFPRGDYEELLVLLVFFVCFAVTIALLLLGGWHAYLITVAETSIEVHINRKELRQHRQNGKVSMSIVPIIFLEGTDEL